MTLQTNFWYTNATLVSIIFLLLTIKTDPTGASDLRGPICSTVTLQNILYTQLQLQERWN